MANGCKRNKMRVLGVVGRGRSELLIGTALQATTLLVLAAPVWAQPAPGARPSGGSVVAGSAAITQGGNVTSIDQVSQRAAINWRSFDIGAQQQVIFHQPGASAVALNRVVGPDPSQIAGRIDANGQVILVNQAGVTFFKGAQVNAQSFIATSANISTASFMAGSMAFDKAGNANARVENRGTITVKQAGLAALVAPRVVNSGVINARMGHVVLAGAQTATLDLYGDGLLALDVSNQVTKAPAGPTGAKVDALVTNEGVIRADGGTVQLTAAAADGVLQNLVQAGGKIAANSVGARTGGVTVTGIGGSVTVTGLLSASGRSADTMGGQVAVNATKNVVLTATARIDASGKAGGGTVAIGTTLQRAIGGSKARSTMTAANVAVLKGAKIDASATTTGNGGNVTILSGGATRMEGTIVAKGGAQAGDGGNVEVSGDRLALPGFIDVIAPRGKLGSILLDPVDLDIIAGNAGNIDGGFTGNTLPFGANDGVPLPSTISAGKIANLGSFGNVTIQATGTIDIQAPINVVGLAQGTTGGLTIQAGGNLTVEPGAPVQASGAILLEAGATFPANTPAPGAALLINDSVTSNGGLVTLKAGGGGIALNGNVIARSTVVAAVVLGTVDLSTTGGGVRQTINTGITAGVLKSSGNVVGTASLLGSNAVSNLGSFAVNTPGTGRADFQFADTLSLIVAGNVSTSAGDIYLQSAGTAGISIAPSITMTAGGGGLASFRADQFQIQTDEAGNSGSVIAGTFELAPFSAGITEFLGSFGLVLDNINANAIRVGAVTTPAAVGPGTTAAAIAITGTFDALGRSLELDATGSIDATGKFSDGVVGTLIGVATLSGTGADWNLPNANTVANLGTITASSFVLNDGTNLTVGGPLNGGSRVAITDIGTLTPTTLTVNGSINATAVTLTAGNIAIPGVVSGSGAVALIANAGTISETGTLIAGTLSGSAVGVADFSGAGPSVNQIATIGAGGGLNLTAGTVVVRDGVGLTVAGTVTALDAAGRVFLATTAPAGITIATTGAVQANTATGTVSLLTDALVNNALVTANTIEIAPSTAGNTVSLGTTGAGLSLASTTGLAAPNLVIGAVTLPSGGAPVVSAGSIVIGGAFAFNGAGALTLDATGAVTQTAPLTVTSTLSGTAGSFALTNLANTFNALTNLTATTGDLSIVSASNLFPDQVSATLGNVYLESAGINGVILLGPVTAPNGRIGIQADALGSDGGSVVANTFELAPFTPGNTVTLGAKAAGLSLAALTLGPVITATTVRIGAVTRPGDTTPTITAGAVTVAGAFDAATTTTLELDAAAIGGGTGAITQAAPLLNVSTLAASGTSVTLANPGNKIATSSGVSASAGDLVLIDSTSLALNGAYTGANLFFEVAAKGGTLTVGASSPATLTSAPAGRISLVADGLLANVAGSIGGPGGTVELAPFSAVNVSLAGAGGAGMLISAGLLSDINVGSGTLLVGAFTNGGTALATTAASITLDGAVDLTGRAGTLRLLANGAITEPGGPLTVGTVTGVAGGDFSLGNGANRIQASTGMVATNGEVILADDPTLVLTGLYSGKNLFFEVTLPGGSLALGTVTAAATLVASPGGRIALVADSMTATATSTITAPAGQVELAPFSAISESVAGTNGNGQLLIDPVLLSDISGGVNALNRLVIGAFTDPRGKAITPTISAAGITLDGALDLSTRTFALQLLANGSVTEPGGPLTVTDVSGSSVGVFSLPNRANAIVQSSGITATKGDVVVVDGIDLTLLGAHTGENLFFEVAAAKGTLRFGGVEQPDAVLTAAPGGRVTAVADQMAVNGGGTITAAGGTVELAPFSAINTSLLGTVTPGQLLIDRALLGIITPGIATLEVGGFTNVPGAATRSTPSAASVTIDGTLSLAPLATTLDLEAIGAVTQSAPIVNVGTLLGLTGSTTLNNAGNTVATLGDYTSGGGFALTDATNLLIAGTLLAGSGANFTVNGALTETGAIIADRLGGSAIGSAILTGKNIIGELDSFATAGASSSFELNNAGALLINGTVNATRIVVSDPTAGISLANGTTFVTGGSVRPPGLVPPASLLPQNGAPGAFLQAANFTQTGQATVIGQGGGPSTLQISVTGNARFDGAVGLAGTGTWLNLNLTNGAATGNVFVNALDISFNIPGSANLFGSINGVTGPVAASLGFIHPTPDRRFLFNNCEIGVIACGLTATLAPPLNENVVFVPIEALLSLVSPALVLDPEDRDNLLDLPVVSKEDY